LARPFLEAGASAVLATLWNVDDAAARQISTEFHRQFIATGDAALALQRAQLAAIHSPNPLDRSPDRWAGFQLIGGLQ
jgi:CHAT domain-containing protein